MATAAHRRTYQLGLLTAGFSCLVCPWVVPWVLGEKYTASIPILMAYSFAFPSFVIGSIRAMDFVICNKNLNHLVVSLCLLPFQVLFCVSGTLWLGPAGLAAAMALVAFVSTTLFSLILPPLRESGALQKEALSGLFRWRSG